MAEVLTGSSEVVGLLSVLQLVESEALSGTLKLPSAQIEFAAGRITGARFKSATGLHALFEILLHRGEAFVFDNEPPPAAPPVGDLAPLLLEACRLMDDWARVDQKVLVPRQALGDSLAALAPWLDGTRTVAAATERAQLLRVQVVDPLLTALDAGAFDTLKAPLAPKLPDDFETLIELGRASSKDGRLQDAREAFERAVMLRPVDRIATQNLRRIVALQRM